MRKIWSSLYSKIKASDGNDTLMSFNMGSPGVEQKISILGYDKTLDIPFFCQILRKAESEEVDEK